MSSDEDLDASQDQPTSRLKPAKSDTMAEHPFASLKVALAREDDIKVPNVQLHTLEGLPQIQCNDTQYSNVGVRGFNDRSRVHSRLNLQGNVCSFKTKSEITKWNSKLK